jgi:transcription initiation factor TFIID subunit 1
LASAEVLSTDEDESTASEESDLEEMGKNLENLLVNKKTSMQVIKEREEMERQELLKLIESKPGGKKKDEESQQQQQQPVTRILRITRTFKNSEGREYTRIETVRRSTVIDAYEKIRRTKDDEFIKKFASMDEAQKEEMKRERRRIQEQLRRIKRNQEKINAAATAHDSHSILGGERMIHSSSSSRDPSVSKESPLKKKMKLKPDLKLKCGACGAVGHMRTNKACPKYTGIMPPVSPVQVKIKFYFFIF